VTYRSAWIKDYLEIEPSLYGNKQAAKRFDSIYRRTQGRI